MRETYSDQVLAWDHWTLSKSTNQNAHDLVAKLEGLSDVELDVICHSRGAGVMRNFFEEPVLRKVLNSRGVRVNVCVYVAGACLGSQLAMTKKRQTPFSANHYSQLATGRVRKLSWTNNCGD